MAGAAAEVIVLQLAVARAKGAIDVVKIYRGTSGTSKTLNYVKQDRSAHVTNSLDSYFGLLKYWRDDAAHATPTVFDEETAFLSLLMLLRLAHFVHERWDELTA